MTDINQNPEQKARDKIDVLLEEAGWKVQQTKKIDFNAGLGVAVREYQTDVGPVDYALFVDKRAVGVIEAKPEEWGHRITTVEEQSSGYANAKLKWVNNKAPLPFVYESTGVITRFTDGRDPKPRSREVFTFHRPETLHEWTGQAASLRGRLQTLPLLNREGLRDCQIIAIENLEASFKEDHPRALIQMATGAGKTFTAITNIYRLLKYADAKRTLFLVDTKNLGEQAEQEFMTYLPNDDNRKFTELYNVQRLKSSFVAKDSQVCISTIQRMYSLLKDQPLDEAVEEINPAELVLPKEPLPVVYNRKIPPEFFDFIFIDECHRSIYNVWRQVIEYFDAYLIGLTATPDNRTYGFFRKNVVSEYTREDTIAGGVNVGDEIYVIETERTKSGGKITASQLVEKRERLTRKKRWEMQDEDETYAARQLDREIVNPDQIRTVIRTFKEKLPEIFPGRNEVPKTLIFAKTDSHADDIIQIVRDEFGAGNEFCKKVTYQSKEDPKSVLAQFRNDYNPRIAVTVDMIATGTDVKPLECLLFMRDVKSRNYFEQMKGRGTRTLDHDNLKKVTPSAATAKTHFVIVDAIGVTKSLKTASQPLITKPSVSLKDLAMGVMMGARDEDTVSSLAGRLARLDKTLNDKEQQRIQEQTGGIALGSIVSGLIGAIEPDRVEGKAREIHQLPASIEPDEDQLAQAQEQLIGEATKAFNGKLIELLETIRREREQTIDNENLDTVVRAEWDDPPVALKVIHTPKVEREPYKRFVQEITFLRKHHSIPGILPLVDAHLPQEPTRDDPPWLAMPIAQPISEALAGCTLVEVVTAVAAIADTLWRLQRDFDVAHRDIKPGNLYYLDGAWLIGDFGLIALPDTKGLTDAGRPLGPAHYTPYEMILDPSKAQPHPADVYSLGKTLWVLATDQRFPPEGHQPAGTRGFQIGDFRPYPKADSLDREVGIATRLHPEERPSKEQFARDLSLWCEMSQDPPAINITQSALRLREKLQVELQHQDIQERRKKLADAATRQLQELIKPLNDSLRSLWPKTQFDLSTDEMTKNLLKSFNHQDADIVFRWQRCTLVAPLDGPTWVTLRMSRCVELSKQGDLIFHAMVYAGPEGVMGPNFHWHETIGSAPVGTIEAEKLLEAGTKQLGDALASGIEYLVDQLPDVAP